ncbi:TetR/AcrR family transcriptional regulator [Nakamurella sp. GG22]
MIDGESSQLRRRGRNRQAILDAALELIEKSGVDGWSMRELAGRVDYTPGALYRYFDSKAALLEVLTADAMQQLRARMIECRSDDGPLALLEELGLAYLDFAATRPTLFRIGLIQTPSRRTSLSSAPGAASPYAVLLDAVRAAVAVDDITTGSTFTDEHVAFTIWATVHGMAVLEQTHLSEFDADFAAIHRPALRRLITGLATGT